MAEVEAGYQEFSGDDEMLILPDEGVGDDENFVPSKVLKQERECIDSSHQGRTSDGQPGDDTPFSLAFSGGGIRAAIFQAGVLWRLAEMNKLKDVEYFTAVSGGGYVTSAFATHVVEAEKQFPPEEGRVKEWYQKAVADTICRMHLNAGDFVRDFVKIKGYSPTADGDGAGLLPRAFDLPILIGTFAVAMSVNPLFFYMVILLPVCLFIELFYGAAMRAAFCAVSKESWTDVYSDWGHVHSLKLCFYGSLLAGFIIFVFRKVLGPCQMTSRKITEMRTKKNAPVGYLIGHGLTGFVNRFAGFLLVVIILVWSAPFLTIEAYSPGERHQLCSAFIAKQATMTTASQQCANGYNGNVWWEHELFKDYDNSTFSSQGSLLPHSARNFPKVFGWILLGAIAFSVCFMPVLGGALLKTVIFAAGPLFLLTMTICVVRGRAYGAITMPEEYDMATWNASTTFWLLLGSLLLPFYEEIRSIMHTYYKRSLQSNFFKNGQDLAFKAIGHSKYCPFVILTGTSSDFRPPGDDDSISELSFSPLHFGSDETGYVKMAPYQSLAKCTALTGAGCLDAISLSMNDALSMRFWLEVLNLSWGDYILFEAREAEWIKQAGATIAEKFGEEWALFATRLLHRLPCAIWWFIIFMLLNTSWWTVQSSGPSCDGAKWTMKVVLILVMATMFGSFLAFLPILDWLSLSPFVRQLHQATKYCFIGDPPRTPPPRMLYVTDGGVKDCTALVQLMRRRCKRILLVLAASDPHDDLGVLKTAMQVARKFKLGSFFDPANPKQDIEILLESYKIKKDMPYMHIGISYGWPADPSIEHGEEEIGHLIIMKNRLPPEFAEDGCKPLLTNDEIMGAPCSCDIDEKWQGIKQAELGPFGCCDCCHTNNLNCGPKFPHGTFTGYLYLSPQWANGLTRLAHAMSAEAVEAVTKEFD